MARAPATPATTQDDPTLPPRVDAAGRWLDDWGLPLSGPDRIAALGDRTDPNIDATGWAEAPLPEQPPAPEPDALATDTPRQEA